MTVYEVLIKTNYCLIKKELLSEKQKQNIVNMFLSSVSTKNETLKFYKGVRFPNNIDKEGRRMYPIYFIPPYNDGKKYKTVMTQTPKTHILSANSYELEIIRLLYLFGSENPVVKNMVSKTLERLRSTCFGNSDDGVGECYDSSLIVLRFLASVAPNEIKWINERIETFHRYFNEKHRIWCLTWYFYLCLSELPFSIAEPEILKYEDEFLKQLNISCVMNSEHDKETHLMLICVVRNCLSRLSQYEYIKDRLPFVNPKDNRLCFDMN